MDSSQLRSLKSPKAIENFESCVEHWRTAMEEMGCWNDVAQQVHFITALCYAVVCKSKSHQQIYKDAYLAPGAVRSADTALPDEIELRIQRVVQDRSRQGLQHELDTALGRFEAPAEHLPGFEEAFRHWVGNGVVWMRQDGDDGIHRFLEEVNDWLKKYRRTGGNVRVRRFINMFAYECKVNFYTCFANTWIDLIPWLREHRGLDDVSERFLRFWHMQNQPIEIPHGRTLGGVRYPTMRGAISQVRGADGSLQRGTIILPTEHVGPTHVRDVFSGQVLSLHPLSAFLMQDRGLCAVAGRLFATEAYTRAFRDGQAAFCSEYWDLMGAILSAAHLYRQALDQQSARRGVHQRQPAQPDLAAVDSEELSAARMFEEYAAVRGMHCPHCQSALVCQSIRPTDPDEDQVQVDFECRDCRRPVPLSIESEDFAVWVRDSE